MVSGSSYLLPRSGSLMAGTHVSIKDHFSDTEARDLSAMGSNIRDSWFEYYLVLQPKFPGKVLHCHEDMNHPLLLVEGEWLSEDLIDKIATELQVEDFAARSGPNSSHGHSGAR